jgi:hypothetical protein
MSKAREKLLKKPGHSFTLSNSEFAFARDLNGSLRFHILRQRLVAGYLTILTQLHLPNFTLGPGMATEFELDLSDESNKLLTVKEVPQREE